MASRAALKLNRRRGKRWPGSRVRIFEADTDLLLETPDELRPRLKRAITVPVRNLTPGPWRPVVRAEETYLGFLILEGAIWRETRLFGRRAVELLGPGDPFRPSEGRDPATLPYEPSWRIVEESRVAILDADFEAKLGAMPGVAGQLVARARGSTRTLANQLAIAGINDLAARLLLMLWHLADRWGRRERGAVILEVPLPHDLLAALVHAARPSVTRRLKLLREHEFLSRRPDGYWVLHGSPPAAFDHIEAGVSPPGPLKLNDGT